MRKTFKVAQKVKTSKARGAVGTFGSWRKGRLTRSADIVETIKGVGLCETLKKKLKVLTAYSAFEEDFLEADIAGRLGLSRGKHRKILLSSGTIWLIFNDLRFQSPKKPNNNRTACPMFGRFLRKS